MSSNLLMHDRAEVAFKRAKLCIVANAVVCLLPFAAVAIVGNGRDCDILYLLLLNAFTTICAVGWVGPAAEDGIRTNRAKSIGAVILAFGVGIAGLLLEFFVSWLFDYGLVPSA